MRIVFSFWKYTVFDFFRLGYEILFSWFFFVLPIEYRYVSLPLSLRLFPLLSCIIIIIIHEHSLLASYLHTPLTLCRQKGSRYCHHCNRSFFFTVYIH
ncbi:hypothetical protein K435DRAFT_432049 [Dendrothele bispora CBS 962.96]|uniref:Uncharacterized protein n=1 Tax=Dendrothele bispora (strain CBS 962.96) TaxID=1314807 RepID=A0A4S8ME58_DENBC|nr:hypothetical protein K435DRAFT_432049 [Dendrothele bispora CBS 962.96]